MPYRIAFALLRTVKASFPHRFDLRTFAELANVGGEERALGGAVVCFPAGWGTEADFRRFDAINAAMEAEF